MRVLVLVKDVPRDAAATPYRADGRLDREAGARVLSGVDGFAVTEATRLAGSGKVVVATMGPSPSEGSLRDALLLGAQRAIHVCDAALAGADATVTARVLGRLVAEIAPDLVLLGRESSDARMGVLPAMIAEGRGWPVLSAVDRLEVGVAGPRPVLSARRRTSHGSTGVVTTLPAVAAIGEYANAPGPLGLDDARRAFATPIERRTAADLGLDAADLVSPTRVTEVVRLDRARREARRPSDPVAAIVDVLEHAGARLGPTRSAIA